MPLESFLAKFLTTYQDASVEEKVRIFNTISDALYAFIGFPHPALNVNLVPCDQVKGNTYNPNKVAPPEMKLLEKSITKDGLTMPVVVSAEKEGKEWVVVDGFHRTTLVQYQQSIRLSLSGYLPVTKLDKSLDDRISSTVRHNLARGTHQVELSARLITMLRKHDWSNERIGKELGMDADEVLRLKQIAGLAEAFADEPFSQSWE